MIAKYVFIFIRFIDSSISRAQFRSRLKGNTFDVGKIRLTVEKYWHDLLCSLSYFGKACNLGLLGINLRRREDLMGA